MVYNWQKILWRSHDLLHITHEPHTFLKPGSIHRVMVDPGLLNGLSKIEITVMQTQVL